MDEVPLGVDELLHKPIGAGELKAAIRRHLGLEAPAVAA
jgi:hypothetical protein